VVLVVIEKPDENIALDLSDRDSDKPRTEAEMRAKTERYNGFPTPPKKRRYRRGGGPQSDYNFAIHGDD